MDCEGRGCQVAEVFHAPGRVAWKTGVADVQRPSAQMFLVARIPHPSPFARLPPRRPGNAPPARPGSRPALDPRFQGQRAQCNRRQHAQQKDEGQNGQDGEEKAQSGATIRGSLNFPNGHEHDHHSPHQAEERAKKRKD